MGLAGALDPIVKPDRLHAAWARAAPPALRRRAGAPRPASVEPPAAAAARNSALIGFARACAWRFAPSRALADEAEAQGLGPVELLPNGLPPEFFEPRTSASRDGPLLMLGSMGHHKGPDLVVAAWRAAFPGGEPGLELRGPAPPGGAVLGHPVQRPLDRAGVIRAMDRARAVVMGSRWVENAPLVLLEARARGAPVVAPRAGGVPELVEEGRDGLLYRPGDAGDLARALREVLQRRWTPAPPPRIEAVAARVEGLLRPGAGR
jgi:glycosyltransferase involved in cell wall biosynthesis